MLYLDINIPTFYFLSKRYASPETFAMFESEKLHQSLTMQDQVMDIYAFGIILWELLERKMPWEGKDYLTIRRCVCSGERPPISHEIEESTDRILVAMLNSMKSAWSHDPIQRPK